MGRKKLTQRAQGSRKRETPGSGRTVSTTMRLRSSLREALLSQARRSGRSLSEVGQELLEEALRMRQCPGIYFATEPSGRTAKVAGTGLAVWEVMRDVPSLGGDEERIKAAFPTLSKAQLAAASMYFRRYPDEIRREIQENASLTPEVVEREYPGLVHMARVG